ncbi:MAG TPA: hypothetical protein VIQ31_09810, partial [Phormidium sp.]
MGNGKIPNINSLKFCYKLISASPRRRVAASVICSKLKEKPYKLLGLVLGIWLMGCSATAPVNSGDIALIPQQKTTNVSNEQKLAQNLGQMLPISAKAR